MTTSETSTSEIRSLAQLAADNKTPIARAVLEYVKSLLHISPKPPHVLRVFNTVSKVSDTVTDIVPRLQSKDGTTKIVTENPKGVPNDETFKISA